MVLICYNSLNTLPCNVAMQSGRNCCQVDIYLQLNISNDSITNHISVMRHGLLLVFSIVLMLLFSLINNNRMYRKLLTVHMTDNYTISRHVRNSTTLYSMISTWAIIIISIIIVNKLNESVWKFSMHSVFVVSCSSTLNKRKYTTVEQP